MGTSSSVPIPNEKALRRLLGPLRRIDPCELVIYRHAITCLQAEGNCQNFPDYEEEESDGEELLFVPRIPRPVLLQYQTFNMWKASMDLGFKFFKIRRAKRIYILPLERFPSFITDFRLNRQIDFFQLLQAFNRAFFLGFEVQLMNGIDMEAEDWNITWRYHKQTKQKQYLVGDIQVQLKEHLPSNGFCVLGITWTDLYPLEELNFVLGEASSTLSSGAFSFGRFEPKAFDGDIPPPPIAKIDGPLVWKMIKVQSHETCHILGLAHCVYFRCAMNESSSVEEAMDQPLFLCPVCLRKLQKACGFSMAARYKALLNILHIVHSQLPFEKFEDSIRWLQRCLRLLEAATPAAAAAVQ